MENIVVRIAEFRLGAAGQALSTYALGSCVALALHDPVAGAGGLLHFMLPDSQLDPARARECPSVFADTGIAALIDALRAHGAEPKRLIAQAAGGARIVDPQGIFDIGRRNYLALCEILQKARIPLAAEDCGGRQSRTVRLEVDNGRFLINQAGAEVELARSARRKEESHAPQA